MLVRTGEAQRLLFRRECKDTTLSMYPVPIQKLSNKVRVVADVEDRFSFFPFFGQER